MDGVSGLGWRYQRAGASGDLPTHTNVGCYVNKWTDFWAHSDFSLRIGRTTSHGPSCFPRAGAVFLPLLLRVKLRFVLLHFFDEFSERFVRLRIRHPRDQPVVMLNLLVEFDTLFTHGAFPHLREEPPSR